MNTPSPHWRPQDGCHHTVVAAHMLLKRARRRGKVVIVGSIAGALQTHPHPPPPAPYALPPTPYKTRFALAPLPRPLTKRAPHTHAAGLAGSGRGP
jgi:hypothetical protein